MKIPSAAVLWTWGAMAILFLATSTFRPLLPIDETRYLTVAWEMYLNKGWLSPLTLNFEPYSHKPPMLFWLINIFWSMFGIGRVQALIPVVLASGGAVILTPILARRLTEKSEFDETKVTLLMIGSIPFLIYSTLTLFDLTLAFFVLAALLSLVSYAESRNIRKIFLMSLFTGLGLLTKGPVAFLYLIFPVLLAPYWVKDFKAAKSWYGHMFLWAACSLLPVLIWLVPVLAQSDDQFAFWLLWEQTAGRIAGNFKDAHIRPFYFYLPFLPVMFAPWIFFPDFWRNLKSLHANETAVKFCLCWAVPTFLVFSLISGKQPHYLVPLLPAAIIFVSILFRNISLRHLARTVFGMLVLYVGLHMAAWAISLPVYNLAPIASYMRAHHDKEWAFVRNYHGELGFLARLEKPLTNLDDIDKIDGWFKMHPDGLAVIRYDEPEEVSQYNAIMSENYRGNYIGIFSGK